MQDETLAATMVPGAVHVVSVTGGHDLHLARWAQGSSGRSMCGRPARPAHDVVSSRRRLCSPCAVRAWDEGFRIVQVATNAWVRLHLSS